MPGVFCNSVITSVHQNQVKGIQGKVQTERHKVHTLNLKIDVCKKGMFEDIRKPACQKGLE